jgi:xylose isomerase
MFFLVRLLENHNYTGPRHFDAHAYRTEDPQGVWDFAAGCMRTYNILKAKAKRFDADSEIQQLLQEINSGDAAHASLLDEVRQGYSKELADKIKTLSFDVERLGRRGYGYERLDQLVVEHILGMR